MKKLLMTGYIKKGKLEYFTAYKNKNGYEKFLQLNDGKKIETTIKVVSGVKYYIHKYYRGYLLPDITAAMGETSQYYVHEMHLKKEFLFKKIKTLDEIPGKHRDKCKFFFDSAGVLLGYTPSMSNITNEEAKEYITRCEERLYIELGSRLGASVSSKEFENHQEEAHRCRQEIYK
jgi:hypothetical protein